MTDTELTVPHKTFCFEDWCIRNWDRRHSHAAIRRSIFPRDLYKQEVVRPREEVFDYREGRPGSALERKKVKNFSIWSAVCVANGPSTSFVNQTKYENDRIMRWALLLQALIFGSTRSRARTTEPTIPGRVT